MSAKALLRSLLEYKAWANAELLDLLETIPEARRDASFGLALRILAHTHIVDRIFIGNMQRKPHGHTATSSAEVPDLGRLKAEMAEADALLAAYLDGLDELALDERIDFTFVDGAPGSMTRGQMLAHLVTHGGYHRGAVGRILNELGTKPPRDTVTVFLHRPAAAAPDRA